jgi:hypothetical protein
VSGSLTRKNAPAGFLVGLQGHLGAVVEAVRQARCGPILGVRGSGTPPFPWLLHARLHTRCTRAAHAVAAQCAPRTAHCAQGKIDFTELRKKGPSPGVGGTERDRTPTARAAGELASLLVAGGCKLACLLVAPTGKKLASPTRTPKPRRILKLLLTYCCWHAYWSWQKSSWMD